MARPTVHVHPLNTDCALLILVQVYVRHNASIMSICRTRITRKYNNKKNTADRLLWIWGPKYWWEKYTRLSEIIFHIQTCMKLKSFRFSTEHKFLILSKRKSYLKDVWVVRTKPRLRTTNECRPNYVTGFFTNQASPLGALPKIYYGNFSHFVDWIKWESCPQEKLLIQAIWRAHTLYLHLHVQYMYFSDFFAFL